MMPAFFDIRIPVITLRVILILLTTLTVSLSVLFPFSCLAFNFFYNYLIPTPMISLPLRDYVLNYDLPSLPPFVVFGQQHTSIYTNHPHTGRSIFSELDPELHYDIDLKFNPACENTGPSRDVLMYKITILTDSFLSRLSPYTMNFSFTRKHHSTWPLTNEIHMLRNPAVLLSSLNSFILRCQRGSTTIKDLLPPITKWFVPPVVADFQYIDDSQTLELLKDVRLADYTNCGFTFQQPWSIVLEFNRPSILIESSDSHLEINVSWKGLRYYLYHYRTISYIFGVSILWGFSSFALFATIGGLILIREISIEEELEPVEDDENYKTQNGIETGTESMAPTSQNQSFLKGDYKNNFEGSTGNIDSSVSEKEESNDTLRP